MADRAMALSYCRPALANTSLTARALDITKKWADGAPDSRRSVTCSTAQATPISLVRSGAASISLLSASGISQWNARGMLTS